MQKKISHSVSGFGLIEIVVAVGIISAVLFSIAQVSKLAHRVIAKSARETQAQFLLEEGVEIMKLLRDAGWAAHIAPLNVGTLYYPVFDELMSVWRLTADNTGPVGGVFTRTVAVGEVYRRNSDDDIVDISSPDPKTVDPGTRKITVRVLWTEAATSASRKGITYIADIHQN